MGSPPHTRDKCPMWGLTTPHFRIIPAYAGQIEGICIRYPARWDHPRIRGTNKTHSRAFFVLAGSSPHTRDKWENHRNYRGWIGIIPAYAGQMIEKLLIYINFRDHPRIRGTNSKEEKTFCTALGSPPHTRDKLPPLALMVIESGITPAYAGQILWCKKLYCSNWDHPRIRGTNVDTFVPLGIPEGSPTHTRDKYSLYHP